MTRVNRLLELAVTGLLAMLGALILLPLVTPSAIPAAQVVTIDANAMIQSFVTPERLEQDPTQFEADLRAWEKRLGDVAAAFAREKGVVVVNTTAVLGGGTDVTRELIERLKE